MVLKAVTSLLNDKPAKIERAVPRLNFIFAACKGYFTSNTFFKKSLV
jgi:hypothetical protein